MVAFSFVSSGGNKERREGKVQFGGREGREAMIFVGDFRLKKEIKKKF